ncbi:MAG: hypothetical protein M1838_001629 [Thelocarpon superellum]|nr:MAG: hypothetical protein M1838_001629 [Thelocarpon superellum]
MASPASTTASHHYPANRRVATLYDAVSGRISSRGFIPSEAAYVQTRDTTTSSLQAVPPEEVLFRRKHAPMRYEEADIYFDTGIPDPSHDPAAHPGGEIKWRKRQQSPPLKRLPDSDLLKALHAYASDFYHRTADAGDAESDWRSLDETALLALGVLIEEEAGRVLGETGDMVFVEAADIVHEREEEADAERESGGIESDGTQDPSTSE